MLYTCILSQSPMLSFPLLEMYSPLSPFSVLNISELASIFNPLNILIQTWSDGGKGSNGSRVTSLKFKTNYKSIKIYGAKLVE